MWILIGISLGVTLTCGWASFRRLQFAIAPVNLDPATLLKALRKEGREALVHALASQGPDSWEHELLVAVQSPHRERAVNVNEVLAELDQRAQRWARVPRVCASIASTTSMMLASVAMRIGLTSAMASADEDLGPALNSTVVGAMNVVAIGIAGALFCVSVQMRARRVVKDRLEAIDKLVDRLESAA